MIRLLHGWGRQVLPLSPNRRYYPEEVATIARRYLSPFWLDVDGMHFRLQRHEWDLALNVAARWHNVTSYNAPRRDTETEEMEERARMHMEAPSEDEETEDEYVTSEEDLVYNDQFYI